MTLGQSPPGHALIVLSARGLTIYFPPTPISVSQRTPPSVLRPFHTARILTALPVSSGVSVATIVRGSWFVFHGPSFCGSFRALSISRWSQFAALPSETPLTAVRRDIALANPVIYKSCTLNISLDCEDLFLILGSIEFFLLLQWINSAQCREYHLLALKVKLIPLLRYDDHICWIFYSTKYT